MQSIPHTCRNPVLFNQTRSQMDDRSQENIYVGFWCPWLGLRLLLPSYLRTGLVEPNFLFCRTIIRQSRPQLSISPAIYNPPHQEAPTNDVVEVRKHQAGRYHSQSSFHVKADSDWTTSILRSTSRKISPPPRHLSLFYLYISPPYYLYPSSND
jgi:hypothetical protein